MTAKNTAAEKLCEIIEEGRKKNPTRYRLTIEFWEQFGNLIWKKVQRQYPVLYKLHGGDDCFKTGPNHLEWNDPFTELVNEIIADVFHPESGEWKHLEKAYDSEEGIKESYLSRTVNRRLSVLVERMGKHAYKNTRKALAHSLHNKNLLQVKQGAPAVVHGDSKTLEKFIKKNPLLCSSSFGLAEKSQLIDVNNHEELEGFFRIEVGFGKLGDQKDKNKEEDKEEDKKSIFMLLIMYDFDPRLVVQLEGYYQRFGHFRPKKLQVLLASLASEYAQAFQAPVEDLLTTYDRQDRVQLHGVLVTLFERWMNEPGRKPVDTAFANFFLNVLECEKHPSKPEDGESLKKFPGTKGRASFNISALIRKTGFSREELEASKDRLLLYAQRRGDWVVSWLERHTQYGGDEGFDD